MLLIFSSSAYQFNPYAVPPMVVSAAMVHIGFVTLRREGINRISLCFFLVIALMTIWLSGIGMSYCSRTAEIAFWWTRFAFFAVCLIPAACFQFSLVFLQQTRRHCLTLALLWIAGGVFEAAVFSPGNQFFTGMHRYWWGWYSLFGPQAKWLILLISFVVFLTLSQYYREYHSEPPDSLHRLRAQSFMEAFGVAYLATVDFLPNYNMAVYPLGYLAILAFIIISNRTIRLYKLQDITPSYAADSIISTMQDALLVLDDDGIIRVANQAAVLLFGKKKREIIGQPVASFLQIPSHPEHAGGMVHQDEFSLETADNKTLFLQISVSRSQPQPRQPAATVCVLHDVTDRKQAEARLKEAHTLLERRVAERTRELEQAHRHLRHSEKLRALGMLTASIAHEIGGPVFAIRNLLEGLHDQECLSEARREILQMGIEECERVGKLLRNLRDLHMPDSGDLAVIDLRRLIDDVLLLCHEQCDKYNINVEKRFCDRPVTIKAATDQIKQVLLNLFTNARDAMPKGGTLTITTESLPGEMRLTVTDTGRGIAPQHLNRIFEPFFTTKKQQFGSGLGLYISYNIIKRHGGTMDVSSKPGNGATFTISLPAA